MLTTVYIPCTLPLIFSAVSISLMISVSQVQIMFLCFLECTILLLLLLFLLSFDQASWHVVSQLSVED